MQKRRWAVFAAAILVAGVAVAAALGGPTRSTKGKTFYFIPKDTLKPYEVIANRGGKIALTELGDKQVVSRVPRTRRRRSSRRFGLPSRRAGGHRDRGQRLGRVVPGSQAGTGRRARMSSRSTLT